MTHPWHPGVPLLLGVMLTGCATSLGDRLGATVSGQPGRVDLQWDAEHPWASQFTSRGAVLVAEYRTPYAGLVRETLAPGRPAGERMLSFALPASLKGAAEGEVCLYVQLPGNRSLLPVRKAQGGAGDTARFRNPAWESSVVAQSHVRAREQEVAVLERRLADLQSAATGRTAVLQQRGWPTAQACDAIPAAVQAAAPTKMPLGVLPAEQQEGAARQTCIGRMATSKRLRDRLVGAFVQKQSRKALESAASLAGMGEQAAELVLQMKAGSDATASAVLAARQQEAKGFQADWRRYSGTLGQGFYPAFGATDDYLELIGEAQGAHQKVILLEQADALGLPADKRPQLSANEILGLAGGMLDSYKGCVSDGRSELKTKWAAWNELQRDSPERNRRVREYYVAECRKQHNDLASALAEQSKVAAQLAAAQQSLASAQAGARSAPPAASPAVLNGVACRI